MIYPNLKTELARADMTLTELAKKIGVTNSTLSLKVNGKNDFTFSEAGKIKEVLSSDLPLDVLFLKK